MAAGKFQPGTIVWAKFSDYPYWPGKIASETVTLQLIERKGYDGLGVLFFGQTQSYALIPENLIEEYDENVKRFEKGDLSEDFQIAMSQAQSKCITEDPPLTIQHRASAKNVKRARIEKEEESDVAEEKEKEKRIADVEEEEKEIVNVEEKEKEILDGDEKEEEKAKVNIIEEKAGDGEVGTSQTDKDAFENIKKVEENKENVTVDNAEEGEKVLENLELAL